MGVACPTPRYVAAIALALSGCSFHPGTFTFTGDAADAPPDAQPDTIDPLADTDGDTVRDGTDNCITVQNLDQHDFDIDGRGDACDPCPHLANMDTDGDGDGVGDACDPQPTTKAEHRMLWTTFDQSSDITGWGIFGDFAVSSGELVHADSSQQHPSIATPTAFQKTYAAIGVRLTANGSGSSGIGLCTDTTGGSLYYCCELREGSPPNLTALSNPGTGAGSTPATWTGTFAPSSRYRLEVNILGTNTCTIHEGSSTVVSASSSSGGPHDGYIFIYVDYAAAAVEYLFAVETM